MYGRMELNYRPFSQTSYIIRTHNRSHAIRRTSSHHGPSDNRASAKLLADASCEEAAEEARPASGSSSKLSFLEDQHHNWTGDEPIQHAVLRMLVDKYKPLRGGVIRTAEEKLRDAPPTSVASITTRDWASEPLLPGVDGHRPWHTTFTAPSTSVRVGRFADSPSSAKPTARAGQARERTKQLEKEQRRRAHEVQRMSKAKESTLDYKLGIKSNVGIVNPVSLKGWNSLIEERIEKARASGFFSNVRGRGKPLARETAETNPFIAREEFLMNRIVQRNGAAPPWVATQGEHQTAIATFRAILRKSWTRRALRILLINHRESHLSRLTLDDIAALRDPEWEAREQAYQDKALEEVNGLVRKYNAMAPYAVRKPYYTRDAELARSYGECAEDILGGIQERLNTSPAEIKDGQDMPSRRDPGTDEAVAPNTMIESTWRIVDVIRRWLAKLRG